MSMKVQSIPMDLLVDLPKLYYKGKLLDFRTTSLIIKFHYNQILFHNVWASGNKDLVRSLMREYYGLIQELSEIDSGYYTEQAFDLGLPRSKLVQDHVFYPQFYGKIFFEFDLINFNNPKDIPQEMIDIIMLCCTIINVAPKSHAKNGLGENEKHRGYSEPRDGLIFIKEDFYGRYRKAGTKLYNPNGILLDDPTEWSFKPNEKMTEYEKNYIILQKAV